MTTASNLFADLPQQMPHEVFTKLVEVANLGIERIVSHGHREQASRGEEAAWLKTD